ncbi:MAG TPA: hypothetical protein VGK99_07400 [Acidobacteriota bacterium]
MQKQLILVLGALLGSCLPASGQMLSARLDLAQKRSAPRFTLLAASSGDWPLAAVTPVRSRTESSVRLPVAFAVVDYQKPKLKRPSRMLRVELVQTPFIRQGRIPLAQLWGGRLQLNGFASEMVMKNVLDGPLNSVHSGTMQPRAVGVYGVRISFRLGRAASL